MIRKFLQKLVQLPIVRNMIAFSHKVTMPGFEGHSLYEVFAFFFRGLFKGGIQNRASAMAFSFFLAVFPSIIFLFTLIPYVPIEHFQDKLFQVIKDLLPENMFLSMQDAILEITHRQNGGLLSFGVIAALYFSKNGLVAMMDGFNNSIHVRETRVAWKQQLIASALFVVLSLVVIVGLSMYVGSEYLLAQTVKKQNFEIFLIKAGKWAIIAGLFLVIIAIFYRYGPAKKRHRIFISPGVLLAAFLTISFSVLFSWYVNNFGNYNSLYGSLGTVMVVMLWIYFNSMMLLIGFELDASIYSAREKKRTLLEQEEVEEAIEAKVSEQAENAARNA